MKKLFRVRDKEYNDYYVWSDSLDKAEEKAREQHDSNLKAEVDEDGNLTVPKEFIMKEIEVLSDKILT